MNMLAARNANVIRLMRCELTGIFVGYETYDHYRFFDWSQGHRAIVRSLV